MVSQDEAARSMWLVTGTLDGDNVRLEMVVPRAHLTDVSISRVGYAPHTAAGDFWHFVRKTGQPETVIGVLVRQRPREVRDPDGDVIYSVQLGERGQDAIHFRSKATDGVWWEMEQNRFPWTPERLRLWADLLANPVEGTPV